MTRRFLVLFHRARTAPDFKLEDLPSSGGRMDLVCRVISASFLISNGIRRDTELFLLLQGPPKPGLALRLRGGQLRNLFPDERSIAAWLQRILAMPVVQGQWLPAGDGAAVARFSLSELLAAVGGTPILALEEGGAQRDVGNAGPEALFVLGDDQGLTAEELQILRKSDVDLASLGPRSLHSDHCIVLVHAALDKAESKNPL